MYILVYLYEDLTTPCYFPQTFGLPGKLTLSVSQTPIKLA